MRWKHDHDSACKPQRKSNGLEYRPFVVNSQNSAPIQYGQASRSESLAQRSDFSSLARIEVPFSDHGRRIGGVRIVCEAGCPTRKTNSESWLLERRAPASLPHRRLPTVPS